MKLWTPISERWHRFKLGGEKLPAERAVVRQDHLASLRIAPGFDALLDIYDSEVVTLLEMWVNTDPSKVHDMRDLHAQGRAVYRMIRLLEGAVSAKEEAMKLERETAARMVQANRVDKEARRLSVAAAIEQRAQGRGAHLASPLGV